MVFCPSAQLAIPLIVVGPPRSGTRFVTNVLNSITEVTIQGEIPEPVMKSVKKLVQECDSFFAENKEKNWLENWDLTKRDFMFAAWANLTKSKRRPSQSNCLYYGYKTPRHEFYFDFYNSFFHPIRPRYICCVRCFIDHFLSVQARWPKINMCRVTKDYISSLRQIRYMKNERPNEVILFFLDDYKEVGAQYLTEHLFVPLGLDNIEQAIRKARQGAVNTAKQLGVKKKKNLSKSQQFFLQLFPWPLKEFDNLRRNFGET